MPDLHYVADRPERLWEAEPLPRALNPELIHASVATPEVSVDFVKLRLQLRAALDASPLITLQFGHRVESIVRVSHGFTLEGTRPSGEVWKQSADIVVNCMWESRLGLDLQLGLEPKRTWVYRL